MILRCFVSSFIVFSTYFTLTVSKAMRNMICEMKCECPERQIGGHAQASCIALVGCPDCRYTFVIMHQFHSGKTVSYYHSLC